MCLLVSSSVVSAQQNVYSRGEVDSSLWWNDSTNPWYYSSSGNQNRPDNFSTRHDVFIGHNNHTTMTVNGAFFQLRTLTIQGSATSARTYNTADGGGISLSVGFTKEAGSGNQTFNVPIGVDGSNVAFTAAGGITTFTDNFFINANTATFDGAGSIVISGTASGSGGAVTKNGAGTLTLSGNNSYTGATGVNHGTLLINGNSSSATGNVTVASGGKLGGTGTIGGDTSISGTYAPGAASAVGTQAFNGKNLTFNSGSVFEWDATSASAFDKVTGINSLLGSGGVFNVVTDISAAFWESSQTFSAVFNTGNMGDVFSSFQLNGANLTSGIVPSKGTFSFSGSSLTWTAIPEPSAALAGLLIAAGLLRRQRR